MTSVHTVGRLLGTAMAIVEALGLTDEVEVRVGRTNDHPSITINIDRQVVTAEIDREALLYRLAAEVDPNTTVRIYDYPTGQRLGSGISLAGHDGVTVAVFACIREAHADAAGEVAA